MTDATFDVSHTLQQHGPPRSHTNRGTHESLTGNHTRFLDTLTQCYLTGHPKHRNTWAPHVFVKLPLKHNLVLASCLLRRRPVCVPMTRTRTAPGTAPATHRHVAPQIHAQPPCFLSCSSATRLTTMTGSNHSPRRLSLEASLSANVKTSYCRLKEEHRRRFEQVYSWGVASEEICRVLPHLAKSFDKAHWCGRYYCQNGWTIQLVPETPFPVYTFRASMQYCVDC